MIIVDGKALEVPGVVTISWEQDPRARTVPAVRRPRKKTERVTAQTLHSTLGYLTKVVRPGAGPGGHALRTIAYWNRCALLPSENPHHRIASAHLVVDHNGAVYQTCDLIREVAYQAGDVNPWTIGLEQCQDSTVDPDHRNRRTGLLYQATIDAAAAVTEWFAELRGLTTTYPGEADGSWDNAFLGERRLLAASIGAFGHCNSSPRSHRGPGDPGRQIFDALRLLGWSGVVC